jgi:hypothetical protein
VWEREKEKERERESEWEREWAQRGRWGRRIGGSFIPVPHLILGRIDLIKLSRARLFCLYFKTIFMKLFFKDIRVWTQDFVLGRWLTSWTILPLLFLWNSLEYATGQLRMWVFEKVHLIICSCAENLVICT